MIGCSRSTLRIASQIVEAVAARQHHVEQHAGRTCRCSALLEPALAVADRVDVVAVVDEHVDETVANRGLVLDDQNAGLRLLHAAA